MRYSIVEFKGTFLNVPKKTKHNISLFFRDGRIFILSTSEKCDKITAELLIDVNDNNVSKGGERK